jgi:hypothetical protein
VLHIKVSGPAKELEKTDFHFVNDICADGNVQASLAQLNGSEVLIFPLRANPEWAFGARVSKSDITFPAGAKFTLQAIEILPPDKVMPTLRVANPTVNFEDPTLKISSNNPAPILSIDGSRIRGAKAIDLEITKANYVFDKLNVPGSNPAFLLKPIRLARTTADIRLRKDLFPSVGSFEIRAQAIDSSRNAIGAPSDHLLIQVLN